MAKLIDCCVRVWCVCVCVCMCVCYLGRHIDALLTTRAGTNTSNVVHDLIIGHHNVAATN